MPKSVDFTFPNLFEVIRRIRFCEFFISSSFIVLSYGTEQVSPNAISTAAGAMKALVALSPFIIGSMASLSNTVEEG